MLSAPPITFNIPTFSSDCPLIETLDWANGTTLIANSYFTFSLFSTYSWKILGSIDPTFIGKQEIKYSA